MLFPEAVIDKLIGDEVMAIYLPIQRTEDRGGAGADARARRELLRAVGYGTTTAVRRDGVGMDFGEAFVGNIGERALYDFTAVGDVVNTASRLQGQAAGGESCFPSGSPRGWRRRRASASSWP